MVLAVELDKITKEDVELIKRLCLPNKVIGLFFGEDVDTIGMRVMRLAAKLKVENRRAVIVKALKLGLVTVDELDYREF